MPKFKTTISGNFESQDELEAWNYAAKLLAYTYALTDNLTGRHVSVGEVEEKVEACHNPGTRTFD